MMTSQILKSAAFTKTKKSRHLENKTLKFIKKEILNAHQGSLYGKKYFCSGGNLEPKESFVILSIICDKVTEEWGDILENLKKKEGHFETT